MQDDRDQNQKIDAAARFAGAVGHDVTNILSVIHGFAELIQLKNRDNPELLRSIEEILQAAKRVTRESGLPSDASRPWVRQPVASSHRRKPCRRGHSRPSQLAVDAIASLLLT